MVAGTPSPRRRQELQQMQLRVWQELRRMELRADDRGRNSEPTITAGIPKTRRRADEHVRNSDEWSSEPTKTSGNPTNGSPSMAGTPMNATPTRCYLCEIKPINSYMAPHLSIGFVIVMSCY